MTKAKILKIVQEGAPVLRAKAKPVADPRSTEIKKLVEDMIATMKDAKGLGLAAPQIGKSLRLFIVDVAAIEGRASRLVSDESERALGETGREDALVFINPEIKNLSKDESSFEEGCLSVQKIWGPVIRPKKLTIKALDENGKPVKIRAKGLLARVIQHETDHINGALFIDKAEELLTVEEEKKNEK